MIDFFMGLQSFRVTISLFKKRKTDNNVMSGF